MASSERGGAGPRIFIGMSFALLEGARSSRRCCRLSAWPAEGDPKLKLRITLRPGAGFPSG